jgi:type I restriction enzyme, S subunit
MYPLNTTDKLTNAYLRWLLLSQHFTAWSVLEADRVAMPKINRETLSDLRLPAPPKAEQDEIAKFLNHETIKLESLLNEVSKSIRLLQERRSALISAAVTGKIDVRGLVRTEAAAA